MNSSWLLFKTFRRYWWALILIEFVLIFCSTLGSAVPSRSESVLSSFGICWLLSAVVSSCIPFQKRFNAMPFPVSNRQRAYFPMLGFVLLWVCGNFGIFLGLLCKGFWFPEMLPAFLLVLLWFPIWIVGYLFLHRILSTKPQWFAFVFILGGQTFGPSSMYESLISNYSDWWLLWIFPTAFYIYEAPLHIAMMDRLASAQPNRSPFPMRDLTISWRQNGVSVLGDLIEAVIFICLAAMWLQNVVIGLIDKQLSSSDWFILLMLALMVISFFKGSYQSTRASGFTPISSIGLSLMQLTVVLIPLAQMLGVRKGTIAKCQQCNSYKLLWATHCPHCEKSGAGKILNKQLSRVVEGKPAVPKWRTTLLIRAFIPLQFLLFSGTVGNMVNRNKPFIVSYVTLSFEHPQNSLDVRTQVNDRVEAFKKNMSESESWTLTSTTDGSPIVLPEKFRLEIAQLGETGLWVRAYGLRWDFPEGVAESLAHALAKDLADITEIQLSESSRSSGSGGLPWKTHGYLDNQIH